MDSNKIEALLTELLEEVKILTVQAKVESIKQFKADYLTSDLRNQIYEAFDGVRTFQQISAAIKCKQNTLQVFAQLLVDNDLVEYEMKGNARIISKSLSKIALYYANKQIGDA